MTLAELTDLVNDMRQFCAKNEVQPENVRVLVHGENGIPRNIILAWDDPVAGPVSMKRALP